LQIEGLLPVAVTASALEPNPVTDAVNASRGKPKPRKTLWKRLVLRASNRDFGFGSGRNLVSLKARRGRPKPLKRSLRNTRKFISNLLCLGSRKTLIFLGFWGLDQNNMTLIWDFLKQVGNPTF
jgi:hypothetical protein